MGSGRLILWLALIFMTSSCLGQSATNMNCTDGDLRLYNKSAPDEGMLQRCNTVNQWEAVCNYGWNCVDAIVACRQLGFNDSWPTLFPDGYFGTWSKMNNFYFTCSSSSYSTLQSCSTTEHGYCYINSYPNRMAGVACHSPNRTCDHGDLRLVGGESESEGRVEVCYKGGWYSVCGTNEQEASIMCKQLGHILYPDSVVFTDGRFGKTPPSQGYITLTCSSSLLDKWTDCTVGNPNCGTCTGDAIKCFTPSECEEGSLRIVDGIIDNEGRVEVCIEGVWGSILSSSYWDYIDAYVACKQLNLSTSGKAPLIYTSSSSFGDGNQRQVMYRPSCNGWENALTDCSFSTSFTQNRLYTAGILCYDDCEDGEVRLVGGAFSSEGTIEVCDQKLWGLVAGSGWSLIDAEVVCGQLGFPAEGVQAVTKSDYGKPRKPVHWSNVHCTGKEQHLYLCDRNEFNTMEEKTSILDHIDVAGVVCQPIANSNTPTTMNENNNSDITSSSPAVLVAPTYLTMLMVIANLVLSIVIVVLFLWRRKSDGTKATNEATSFPMTSRDSSAVRYVGNQHKQYHASTIATSHPGKVPTSQYPTSSASPRPTTSYPTPAAISHPGTVGMPASTAVTLPTPASKLPQPPPPANSQAFDECEPMYELTDTVMADYTDMA